MLYHLALGRWDKDHIELSYSVDRSGSHDLQQMFGDVKFVCMSGYGSCLCCYLTYVVFGWRVVFLVLGV